jgi:protein-S-isoprenylcysteine O-methyltransferase Ste14
MPFHQLNVTAAVGLAVCWGAFFVTWLAGAIYFQSVEPAERTRSRFSAVQISLVVTAIAWVAVPRDDWRALNWHAVNAYVTWLRLVGLAILLAATAFTVWSRIALGAMWSAAPVVKEGHQLRTRGPYGVTRHPIYTGMLGMMLGSALLAGGRWIVPFPTYLLLFAIKIHLEERLMLAEFPEEYPRYRQRVPRLIPGLRLITGLRPTSRSTTTAPGR